ncbi:hypothetical protein ASC80_05935 [Afipia sp. Root123D2]|uniref:hypothetical protein n=1 Tax=Afipia sp. Root123D2 TaxID=1736436 RepID=UPI000701E5FE|nr:hypothetical protein [Afipia sp. Root123D2]KQW22878.1 hypothetical protein ASC80_05935 [Afipia sp. Root123D2]
MIGTRTHDSHEDVSSLEATAASARAGFACMFSTADEYESALITERRAQGRYATRIDWQPLMLAGCVFILSGVLLIVL